MQYFSLTDKVSKIIGSCRCSDRQEGYLVSKANIPIICSTLPNKLQKAKSNSCTTGSGVPRPEVVERGGGGTCLTTKAVTSCDLG